MIEVKGKSSLPKAIILISYNYKSLYSGSFPVWRRVFVLIWLFHNFVCFLPILTQSHELYCVLPLRLAAMSQLKVLNKCYLERITLFHWIIESKSSLYKRWYKVIVMLHHGQRPRLLRQLVASVLCYCSVLLCACLNIIFFTFISLCLNIPIHLTNIKVVWTEINLTRCFYDWLAELCSYVMTGSIWRFYNN